AIQVHSGNADLVCDRRSRVHVVGDIPVAAEAQAKFAEECRREDMGVVETSGLSFIDAGAGKSIRGRSAGPAEDPINAGIKYFGPLKVVANEKRVGGVDVMVDLHVKGVGIFNTDGVGLIVVCKTGTGRRSDVAEKFLGNRTDTVVRNNVS